MILLLLLQTPLFATTPLDQQISTWQKRIALDPDDYISPTKLGDLLLQKARSTGEFSTNVEAEKNLRLALKRNPQHFSAVVLLASACIAQHKFSQALSLAEQAVESRPTDAFAQAVLGDARLELGKIDDATQAYEKGLELAPGLPTHSRIAYLQWVRGDVPAALRSYADALEAGEISSASADDLGWCHVQKGELHFRIGDFKKADEEYAAAAKLLPDHFSVLEHLAELRAAQTRYDESLALYRKVIAQTSRPEFLQALGDVYKFIGKMNEARPWHEQALAGYLKATNAGDPHYYHHLASFFCDIQTNAVEALKWARKDFAVRQNVYAYDTLAWALYQNGKWDEAFAAAKKALAFGTKDSHVLLHASSIYANVGKRKEAAALIRQATETNPHYQSFHAHR